MHNWGASGSGESFTGRASWTGGFATWRRNIFGEDLRVQRGFATVISMGNEAEPEALTPEQTGACDWDLGSLVLDA